MKKCFVISPIGSHGSPIREHADNVFEFIISPAMKRLEINTVRADQLLEPGKITDQMFREIFSSDLCVAILTGHNPNVFYELALAQAARRPVVVLIEKDQEIPFDVRDLRCVVYDFNPRTLLNKTYADQLVAHLLSIQDRNWTMSSPFDAFFREAGFVHPIDEGLQEGPSSYSVSHGRLKVRVLLGRIEQAGCGQDCLVALPANEFFDNDCIQDVRSALGAYVQHHFRGRIEELQTLVAVQLQRVPSTEVEKEHGVRAPSYGVGTCLYLGRPLDSAAPLALVSVTTKRPGQGLRASLKTVYDALLAIQRVMADNRLTAVCLPTLGSGHGGLSGELSLFCMLVSLAELYKQPSGPTCRDVSIVVYQRDERSEPALSRKSIRLALSTVRDLFAA